MILSAYSRDDVPEGFVAQAEIVLTGYPPEVVRYITDPRATGIQRKNKYRPNIADIVAACDEHMNHLRRVAEALTPRRPDPVDVDAPPRGERKSYEELVDLCARDGLLIGRNRSAAVRVSPAENEAILAKHGVTPEALAALPNAKTYKGALGAAMDGLVKKVEPK